MVQIQLGIQSLLANELVCSSIKKKKKREKLKPLEVELKNSSQFYMVSRRQQKNTKGQDLAPLTSQEDSPFSFPFSDPCSLNHDLQKYGTFLPRVPIKIQTHSFEPNITIIINGVSV